MEFLDQLFLRTPFYSYARYDLARLPEVLQQVPFRNALRLASPVVYSQLEKKGFDFGRLTAKEQHTLAKYYNRMCFRPTPFGGFAAFSLAGWGTRPVQLAAEKDCRLLLLPDNAAAAQAAGDWLIRNPTLYRLGKSWRYYRSELNADGYLDYTLDELEAVRFNNDLLRRCEPGIKKAELLSWIAAAGACSAADAADYLAFLLADQVLYDTARGALITPESALSVSATAELGPGTYYAALTRPMIGGGVTTADREELALVIAALQRWALPASTPDLQQFIKDFSDRFDLEKVPLLLALDPDSGLGYGRSAAVSGDRQPDWSPLRRLLFGLWTANSRRDYYDPIGLAAGDPEPAGPATAVSLPNTLAVMFRQTAGRLVLEQVAGSSATQLLGRFSPFSDQVQSLCSELAAMESTANPAVIFADIHQLSHRHYDNINRRKPIYDYELPLNVFAESTTKQVMPADLLLSVRNGELLLESQKLGKRVIPRLATAYHYPHTRQDLFRLLGDLQYQGLAGPLLPDLAVLFPGLDFYPRLVYGRTVLSLAKWHFSGAALRELSAENIAAFRQKNHLPALVMLGRGDQQLVFDLSDEREIAFFLDCTRGLDSITLQEYLPAGKQVKTGHKPLAGEYIAVIRHEEQIYEGIIAGNRAGKIRRDFPPGSDWLYLKIYSTPATADRLLAEVIRPVLGKFAHRLNGWFFIRYTDPDTHLRLRFRLAGEESGSLLAALQNQLQSRRLAGLVRGFRADTYRRELERYGPQLITQVEKVAEAGSNLVIDRLRTGQPVTPGESLALARQMVACFFPETAEQLRFAAKITENFLEEFGTEKKLRLDLDRSYRSLRNEANNQLKTNRLLEQTRLLVTMVAGKSERVRYSLLADLVHMQLNRLFNTDQRRQELLVYYCLQKELTSQLAVKSFTVGPADRQA